jgi:hypothetical protein
MALLSVGNLALLALGYIAWCALYQIVYYRFFHPLSKFPGSFWASVTRLWIAYHNVKGDECAVFQELHKKHGEYQGPPRAESREPSPWLPARSLLTTITQVPLYASLRLCSS